MLQLADTEHCNMDTFFQLFYYVWCDVMETIVYDVDRFIIVELFVII